MEGLVHSFESFATVDGPGIRFVIFLKGCPLRCKYCHNPDTWKMSGAKKFSVDQILKKYDTVKEIASGGITVSGGEPLLQMEFLEELFYKCRKKKINTCLDTSGYGFIYNDKYITMIENVDLIMLDIKHIDEKEHILLTGVSLNPILRFADFLDKKKINTWVRHVIVPGMNLKDSYLFEIGCLLRGFSNISGVEVLGYHSMAVNKYEKLSIKYPLLGTRDATLKEVKRARMIIIYAMRKDVFS